MKKYLLAALSGALIWTGVVSATLILETPPQTNTTKPTVRPSLNKVLDRRPVLPTKKPTTGSALTGKVLPATTGNAMPVTTGTVIKTVVRQNAEDVKAYRAENGYIIRFLKKATSVAERKSIGSTVEAAIKTLLATQKSMRQTYDAAAKTTTLMTKESWNTQADAAVVAYRTSILPYIDPTKLEAFEKFIIGRTNLLKGIFDKLETIRTVKAQ